MENKIIKLFQYFESYLKQNFPITGLKLYQLLKKEFINNLLFADENYSILHIAVLNNWTNFVDYLMKNWPININYQDSSGNTAWNYACLLLQPKNALLIKTKNQFSLEDKEFLKQLVPLSLHWNSFPEFTIDKLASENRKKIIDYSFPIAVETGIDAYQYANSIDLSTNKYHSVNTLTI